MTAKIMIVSDNAVSTGYGRIADHMGQLLAARGYQVFAASFVYDGLLPAQYEGKNLPYHVASLAGHANWPEQVANISRAIMPDVMLVIQDAPYLEQVRNLPLDWSVMAFVGITPVDGVPLYPDWVRLFKLADGMLTISEFGVEAHRQVGVKSRLCRPAADGSSFYPLSADERLNVRNRLGIAPNAFVVGSCAQNQGRKCWPEMLEGFFDATKDLPDARFIAVTEPISPAGWNLPVVMQQQGWDASKVMFRPDCHQKGVHNLRELYGAMDVHTVLAHREGFGLPIVEAQMCGIANMALDYCSGTEQCGGGNGVLVNRHAISQVSTWGGALDYFPDVKDYATKLRELHDNPAKRQLVAMMGMNHAQNFTWEKAGNNVLTTIEEVLNVKRALPNRLQPPNV